MNGYIETFKNKNNKLMSLRVDDDKLLEKYKAIWNKIESSKNIRFNALPVYDNGHIKSKLKLK